MRKYVTIVSYVCRVLKIPEIKSPENCRIIGLEFENANE